MIGIATVIVPAMDPWRWELAAQLLTNPQYVG